jgi:hypothetical protein
MMIIAAIAFSGVGVLVWYILTNFVRFGALNSFLIMLALGPVSLIAGYFFGRAEQDAQYGGGWSLPVGRLLGVIGCAAFGILSFKPFFAAWRATAGFWPHFLLVLLFSWIIFLLVYALMFLIKLFTG